MKQVPGYSKVFQLGSAGTERALVGPVVVQEKVDGSMMCFGINEDGELVMRSHHQPLDPDTCPKQFRAAMEHVRSLDLAWVLPDTYFYAEMLDTAKHNTICYSRIPTNHLVLFDMISSSGWYGREDLAIVAERLQIDLVPELYCGEVNVEMLRTLLSTQSYLGSSTVEGVVVKNYHETVCPGGRMQPLFVKLVNEAFKERNQKEFKAKTTRGTIEEYIASFQSEARWMKACQHLRDQGLLVGEPRDIGALVKEIDRDLLEEESENIKEELFRLVRGEILRKAKMGFPEFYKNKLIEWTFPTGG
jgi:hypothetical protein